MNHPEEFIGSEVKVTAAKNKSLMGLQGKIVDETMTTFIIIAEGKAQKAIPKKGCVFLINNIQVKGDDIEQRPEDRIKTRR